jgi:hypothetical protein
MARSNGRQQQRRSPPPADRQPLVERLGPEADRAPPKPNPIRLHAALSKTREPQQQREAIQVFRDAILARAEYLARWAGAAPRDFAPGIPKRLDRVLDQAEAARRWAKVGRWPEAQRAYEDAEQVAVNADLWARAWVAEREAATRARLPRIGAEASKAAAADRRAERLNQGIIEKALAFRKRHEHENLPLSATMNHLRQVIPTLEASDSTLRRDLNAHGMR